MKHELIEQLQERVNRLIIAAQHLQAENARLRQHHAELSTQLQTQTAPNESITNPQDYTQIQQERDELKQRNAKLESQLLKEEERFRIEYTLLQQQYEHNIARLNQALAAQMHNVKTQQPSHDASELEKLRQENTAYRQKLKESLTLAQTLTEQLHHLMGE